MTKAMVGQTVPFWDMPTACAVMAAISHCPKPIKPAALPTNAGSTPMAPEVAPGWLMPWPSEIRPIGRNNANGTGVRLKFQTTMTGHANSANPAPATIRRWVPQRWATRAVTRLPAM